MEDAGLVVREKSPDDRRAMRVYLTETGRAMRGRLDDMWSTLEEASASGLTEQQIEAFITAGESIRKSLMHQNAQDPHPATQPGLT